MSVDTKMFVTAKREAILDIMPKVIACLEQWQRNELDNYWKSKRFDNRVQYLFRDKSLDKDKGLVNFTNGISGCETRDFGSFSIYFTVHGENRRLFITHTCSNDYSDVYKGDKIIFNLGCWGMSEEIMMLVSEAVKDFGDVYFTKNDSENDFERLEFDSVSAE